MKSSRPGLRHDPSSAQHVHVRAPDEDLVTLTLSGNREAFEQLVRRHQRPLINHLYRITGQRD